MTKLRPLLLGLVLFTTVANAKPFEEMFPDLVNTLSLEELEMLDGMDYQTGTVTVWDDLASFELGENYYYLNPKDAEHVLITLWGNPPLGYPTMGMIFPADKTPMDDTWGIEITFDGIGYVSDEDAGNYDYDALLSTMQQDTREESEFRKQEGYEGIELIGWAETPRYEADRRMLYWAKEFAFETMDTNTLNYNIRALGRNGVLVINFIAGMDQLEEVRAATPDVLAMTSFLPGNRYSDFDPSIDKVAAVGIGGLIAGKVLAKTGFLAVALVFLKKFWFLAFIPLIWLKGKLFNRNDTNS